VADSELPLRLLDVRDSGFAEQFDALCQRRLALRADVDRVVAEILEDVRRRGDDAVIDATERYDGYRLTPDELAVTRAEIETAAGELEAADREALAAAAERIQAFHARAVPRSWRVESGEELLGQEVRPLSRVGVYLPAFKAPLASSVLMIAIPARVAGVEERIMCTPGRRIHPAVLEAARLAGLTQLFRVGGAQAVGALAYGTESIPRVDKIAGPGNVYTQAAKRQVFGEVAIDSEAGPSEVLIVAGSGASAAFLAADLIAQAEHEERASVVLASPDEELVRAALREVEKQLSDLPRREIARHSLRHCGAAIVTRSVEEAIELSNRYAPEHLQLVLDDAESYLDRVQHAGAVFLGPLSPVPVGDYVAGPSHVLPTGGTARFFSPLGVEDFTKRMSVIRLGQAELDAAGPAAVRLAELEGLHGHARSVGIRLRKSDES
jgi:histidinol dehydrogenase